jgi:hypothetical protein
MFSKRGKTEGEDAGEVEKNGVLFTQIGSTPFLLSRPVLAFNVSSS